MRQALSIAAIVAGLLVVAAVFLNNSKNAPNQNAQTDTVLNSPSPDTPPEGAAAHDAAQQQTGEGSPTPPASAVEQAGRDLAAQAPNAADTGTQNTTQSNPTDSTASTPEPVAPVSTEPTAPVAVYHILTPQTNPQTSEIGAPLDSEGKLDATTGDKLRVKLSAWGASIMKISLVDYHTTAKGQEPYVLMSSVQDPNGGGWWYPFAAQALTLNSVDVPLQTVAWELVEPGHYRVTIGNENSQPLVTIDRTYTLGSGVQGYDIQCTQRFTNHTDKPIKLTWKQIAQGDTTADDATYIGDQRHMIAGYHNLQYDPNRVLVSAKETYVSRSSVISNFADKGKPYWPIADLPPEPNTELVWLACVSRYFALAVHEPVKPDVTYAAAPALADGFTDPSILVIGQPGQAHGRGADPRLFFFTLTSKPFDLAPNATSDLSLCLFAGPRKNELLRSEPYSLFNFKELIVYTLGGPCTLCTFQWLAKALLWFLDLLHAITFDWGISIIILVIVVRGLLHPITKKSQIQMMKMGKMMQTLQPELEKLKKKYANDQQKLQAEQMKLYREKGVNPANMLGCLPMFLQTPIWIALYAMLYFAIELRHQPAFYGIFQFVSGGHWDFLRDLSKYDDFIRIADGGFHMPLIGTYIPYSINLLPILMAVVFYFQQKLSTPPPANEQAAQQQKIMKFMVFLFPIFLYPAPSGLTLYIMSSTFAGVIDSWIVRRHIKREEEAGTLFVKKPHKPGGLMDRLTRMAEAKQEEMLRKDAGKKKDRR
ncbi:MAG: membrane protein insertase YidC [Phycisphaera sp.]|nr:membrane protein insertase YidC [Phycisphaera sp.]